MAPLIRTSVEHFQVLQNDADVDYFLDNLRGNNALQYHISVNVNAKDNNL